MSEEKLKELNIGIEVANNILERINHINNYLKQSNEDATILLKENIFSNELDLDFLMKNVLILFGEEYLNEFQLSYANKVIGVIKNKIPYDDVYLNIEKSDDGYFYIILSTIINEIPYPLLTINYYLKQIYYLEDENVNYILNEIEILKKEITKLEDYYEKLELSKDNPLHLAGENSIKMMDMLIRKKKYAEEIGKEKNNTLDLINEYNNKIYQYKAMLSEMEMDRIKCSMVIDKYVDRLTKYYNYKVFKTDNIDTPNIDYNSYDELDVSQLDFSENP